MKSDFYERRERKLEAYKKLASKFKDQSNGFFAISQKMASCIPMGQPILVGHHSEKSDRNFRERIHKSWGKSIEAQNKADHYSGRAASIETNRAISSDDPEAIAKLKIELENLERLQLSMKEINKICKSLKLTDEQKISKLKTVFPQKTEIQISQYLEKDRFGQIGVPSYKLTNNGANIRRIKLRIEHLTKLNSQSTTEKVIGGVRIVDNVEDNRLQMFFQEKPGDDVRKKLRDHGFNWSPSQGCWQRFRSNSASCFAESLLKSVI